MQQAFKQYSQRSLDDCVFKFFELMEKVWQYDVERFPCSLGVYFIFILFEIIYFLPLDEAVVSRAVFVIVSGMGKNSFGAN